MPYGYRGLKIFTSLTLRFHDFQRLYLVACNWAIKTPPDQMICGFVYFFESLETYKGFAAFMAASDIGI
jgi:hypothetical protein